MTLRPKSVSSKHSSKVIKKAAKPADLTKVQQRVGLHRGSLMEETHMEEAKKGTE